MSLTPPDILSHFLCKWGFCFVILVPSIRSNCAKRGFLFPQWFPLQSPRVFTDTATDGNKGLSWNRYQNGHIPPWRGYVGTLFHHHLVGLYLSLTKMLLSSCSHRFTRTLISLRPIQPHQRGRAGALQDPSYSIFGPKKSGFRELTSLNIITISPNGIVWGFASTMATSFVEGEDDRCFCRNFLSGIHAAAAY